MSTMRAILCSAALLTAANAFTAPARRLSTVARRATVAEWRDACGDGVVSYADFGLRLTPYLSSASAADVGREPGSCDPWDPKSPEYCSPTAPAKEKKTLRLFALFTLWYALNTGYNIGNKMVLNALPIPWTSATIELFFGLPYVGLLWASGLRKAPSLSAANVRTLCPSAFFLACTHVAGVISFGAGAISFTHILKATEPVWSALISAVVFREVLPLPVLATLVPIIGGVGLASLKELSFTTVGFVAGTLSAVTSASKAIFSKKVLDGKPLGKNLTPANMFAVLTILGFLMILPASLAVEGPGTVAAAWAAARADGHSALELWGLLGASGFLYYLYNEVAFLALSEVGPLTHAVTNTVKRVVIILASVVVFQTPITPLGCLGSGVAIAGALLYSLAKRKY
ncbi:solute carrier family protein [Aureococcus anophagefferens]|uniref:Solute carrier family protein n=2 Tax=Aureococcus anophagefferens TaxID=44056 RepID=A0ABR1GD06_AURAN